MKIFYLCSEKAKQEKFEAQRKVISRKGNNNELKNEIQELLNILSDFESIKRLAEKEGYFNASISSWELAYRLATKILEKERGSDEITYRFELTNYLFHFYMQEGEFRKTFFLMHGKPLVVDSADTLLVEIWGGEYTIYKGDEEWRSTYLVPGDKVGIDLKNILLKNKPDISYSNETRIFIQIYD